jgi:hypothetical protein
MRWWGWVILGGACLVTREADACSYGPLEEHVIDQDEKAVDSTPPSAIGKTTYSIRRGTGPERDGCSESASSCDDIASLSLYLGEVTDDRTDAEHMGYAVKVVGNAPSDSTWPSGPVRVEERTMYLHWVDGDTDDQESVDFTLCIRAVDLAGNEGPENCVHVQDDGSSSGCRLAPAGVDVSWAFVVALLGVLARRARRG